MQKVSSLVSKDISNYLTNRASWNIFYNAKSEGLAGDGTTDDYADLSTLINTTINGAEATIIFSPGTYKISTNITIPSNISLFLTKGAMLSPDSGKTITINGQVEAGLWKIFTGSGTIVAGSMKVDVFYPQWWGAVGDGVTDDKAAIQAAIDAIAPYVWNGTLQNTQNLTAIMKELYFPPGVYAVSDTLLLSPNIMYNGYGATIQAKNFSNKQKFVAEAKVFKNDGTLATGWTYGTTNYDIHTFVKLYINDLDFDGEVDGVYGGLSLTNFVYGILQDSYIKGKYVGLRNERSFNNRFENVNGEGGYAGLAITSNTTDKFSNCHFVGKNNCTSAGDVTILDAADSWLYRTFQDTDYKNYGRGVNICWVNNLDFDTLTTEGCYAAGFLHHCSLTIKNLYTEYIGYGTWTAANVDGLFFGQDAKLMIESHVWTSTVEKYIFDGNYSQIRIGRSNHTDYASFNQTIKGIKGGTGAELVYNSSQYTLSANSSEKTIDEYEQTVTLTNTGNATTVTYTKYGSGLMVVSATGFYSLASPPYELTWTLPVAFKDVNSFTVHGMRAGTGTYKRGSTVTPMEIVNTSSIILSFSNNDITYNVTAIGRWK